MHMQTKRKIAVLGSTGSIGTQALQVAALHSDRFQITALTANRSRESSSSRCAGSGPSWPVWWSLSPWKRSRTI